MSETWYRTVARYAETIDPVQIDRATEHTVILADAKQADLGGRRRLKHSGWDDYFPTRDLAKAHIVSVAQNRLDRALDELKDARRRLEAAESL